MTKIERTLQSYLKKDLSKKIVVLAGPRQCGKTTLARRLASSQDYLNYDSLEDRTIIHNKQWDRKKELIIFDELHKMPKWKSWIKGVFDKEGLEPALFVTGSARLNTFRKFGDSLAGRHFYFRLHPFDLKELSDVAFKMNSDEIFKRLLNVGGYPEPFLEGSLNEYKRWRAGHTDLIIRQDLLDLEPVRDVRSIELLLNMLRSKVGSPISANALSIDLQKDQKTIQKWLQMLEDVFLIFRVIPYSKDITRAVKKEPKFYFYDTGYVDGSDAQKFENLIACSLLKECHFQTDAIGRPLNLHYLKIKGGREIDFAIIPEDKSERVTMVEAKWGDKEPSPNFKLFSSHFKKPKQIQIVVDLKRELTTSSGVEVRQAVEWLSSFKI
jgi:predicted AAA+ superfamily ATPase